MQVYFYDVVTKLPLGNARQVRDLHQLLAQSDIVTLHVPETQATQWMIGAAEMVLKGCTAAYDLAAEFPLPTVEGLTAIDYPMPAGSIAGYYPELNPLLPLAYYDPISGCPAAKSIPVRVVGD